MKSIFFLFVLTITLSVTGQNNDLMSSLQNDDAALLSTMLTAENINKCYKGGNSEYTLLALSIKNEKIASFATLLKNDNIDLNKECTGKTPLFYTAKYGKLAMMKSLFNAGANSKLTYKNRTLLEYAKKYEHTEMVKYLTN